MWKNFFYFPKGQQIAIITLIILIIIVTGLSVVVPYLSKPEEPENDPAFISEVDDFMKNLQSTDSLRKLEWENKYERRFPDYTYESDKKPLVQLFKFNPNDADSITFIKLGIQPYAIKNIIKYREKGGKFKNAEAFAKVYGISQEKYEELKPYIDIENEPSNEKKTDSITLKLKTTEQFTEKRVEINSADTTELMSVKGIGRKYAIGIVKYRKILGGYYDIEQLREVYGMTADNFEKIRDKLTVDKSLINKIDVNTASLDRLKAHPYLNFYQAKAIYELRRNKIKLKKISELDFLNEFTPEQLKKIEPYLKFGE